MTGEWVFLSVSDRLLVDRQFLKSYKHCVFQHSTNHLVEFKAFSQDHPIYINITSPSAVKTLCKIHQGNQSIMKLSKLFYGNKSYETIEFPLKLKDRHIYLNKEWNPRHGHGTTVYSNANCCPSNDMELEMHITPIAENLHAVQLSWTCPSEWKGIPDVYRIACVKIQPSGY